MTYNKVKDYEPGEPYEFEALDPFDDDVYVTRYRCFRGDCKGRAVFVSDRNTHNQYHNGTLKVDNGFDDYEYEWEF